MDNEMTLIAKLGFHHLDHAPNVETVDLSKFRTIDKTIWQQLGSCNWLTLCQNALVLGPHGIGKTYLSAALCTRALQSGYSVRRSTLSNLQRVLATQNNNSDRQQLLDVGLFTNLLIVDDFLPGLLLDPDEAAQVWAFLAGRQSHDSVMLITSLPIHCWRLVDNPLVVSYVNSILLNAIVLEIKEKLCLRPIRRSD